MELLHVLDQVRIGIMVMVMVMVMVRAGAGDPFLELLDMLD